MASSSSGSSVHGILLQMDPEGLCGGSSTARGEHRAADTPLTKEGEGHPLQLSTQLWEAHTHGAVREEGDTRQPARSAESTLVINGGDRGHSQMALTSKTLHPESALGDCSPAGRCMALDKVLDLTAWARDSL